jgi:hypothetical protein
MLRACHVNFQIQRACHAEEVEARLILWKSARMSREAGDHSLQKWQIVRACHVNSHTIRACRVEYCLSRIILNQHVVGKRSESFAIYDCKGVRRSVVAQRASDWNRLLPEEWLLDYGVLRLTSVRCLVGVGTLLPLGMPDLVFARRLLDDARPLLQNTHLDILRD